MKLEKNYNRKKLHIEDGNWKRLQLKKTENYNRLEWQKTGIEDGSVRRLEIND